jgi:formylglycine-generating enzyme required for sulfatase activity
MIGVTGGRADDFRIALTEVTNHQYRLCTSQGPCEEPNSIASSESPFDNATFDGYAVVGVNALQAREFCQWVGADLPTFEQWQDAVARYASLEWPMSSGGMEIVRPEVGQEPWEQPFPRPVVDTERSNSGGRPSYLIGLNQEWTRSECDEVKCQAWPASDRRPHGDLRVVGIADPYATSSEKYALGSTSWFVDVRFDLVNADIQETYVSFRCVTA